MLTEGLGLMVTGMGVVFAFLTLLVMTMLASAKFFDRFSDYFQEETPEQKPRTGGPQQSEDVLAEIAVAIAAAKACARS